MRKTKTTTCVILAGGRQRQSLQEEDKDKDMYNPDRRKKLIPS